jgi:hypothetical protein
MYDYNYTKNGDIFKSYSSFTGHQLLQICKPKFAKILKLVE